MWKYSMRRIKSRCDTCIHDCKLPYLDILRRVGYSKVSCTFPLNYIRDIGMETMNDSVNIVVLKNDILDTHGNIIGTLDGNVSRIDYIEAVEFAGTAIMVVE